MTDTDGSETFGNALNRIGEEVKQALSKEKRLTEHSADFISFFVKHILFVHFLYAQLIDEHPEKKVRVLEIKKSFENTKVSNLGLGDVEYCEIAMATLNFCADLFEKIEEDYFKNLDEQTKK